MKHSLFLLLLLTSCTAFAQSQQAIDSIAARFHGGFITIQYDEHGKPDIDTTALRVYEEQRQKISDDNRRNCSCNPFNIAKRMKEAREREALLTPAQRDSISNYYMNSPIFDDKDYKPFGLLDSTRQDKPLYDPAVLDQLHISNQQPLP